MASTSPASSSTLLTPVHRQDSSPSENSLLCTAQVQRAAFENGSFQCISLMCYFCVLILNFVADSDFSCCLERMLWLYQHLLDPNFNGIQVGGHVLLYSPALCLLGEATGICPSSFMKGPGDSRAQVPFFLSIFISPAQHPQKTLTGDSGAAVTLLMDMGMSLMPLAQQSPAKNH